MRWPAPERAKKRYGEVFRDPALASELLSYDFKVDGRSLAVPELRSYSEEPPAPGMTLEASVPYGVYAPPREGSDVTLSIGLVGSSMMRTFTGRLLRPVRDGELLSLVAVSPGYYHERMKYYRLFGQLADFAGRAPSDVAHEMLAAMRLYRGLDVTRIAKPLYSATGENAFDIEATLGQILESVRDASGLWIFDDGRAFARGMSLERLEQPNDPVASWQVGPSIIPSTFIHTPRDEERYRDVTVYRLVIDEPEIIIGGSSLASKFVDVPYRDARARPPIGVTLPIQTEDPDVAAALSQALSTAGSINAGAYNWEFQTPFIDPRIERADTLKWTETVFEGDNRVERMWLGVVGRVEHNPIEGRALYGGIGNIYRTQVSSYSTNIPMTFQKSPGVRAA